MCGRRQKSTRQHGAALVETLIVTPLLLLLIVGTAEITNVFVEHNTLTKAVRAGARHIAGKAIIGTTGVVVLSPQLITETQNIVVFGNAAGTGTAILNGLAAGDVQVLDVGSDNVQVTANYNYNGIIGSTVPSFGLGSDIGLLYNLRATVTMRAL